MLKKIQMQMG